MPAVVPNELKPSSWEQLKKTLPGGYDKDKTVAPTLVALQSAVNAVNWNILEQAVENANRATERKDREQIIAGATVQLNKLASVSDAAGKAKKAMGALKAKISGVAGFAKAYATLDGFQKFVEGFGKQTKDKLGKSRSQAANRAGQLTLDKVLSNPALRLKFEDFLKKEQSLENLEFLDAVKKGASKAVYDKFIKAENVNVSDAVKRPLEAAYYPPVVKPEHWKAAYAEVSKLLSFDTLRRFKETL